MTERLDHLNAYRQHFDALVLAIEQREGVPAVLHDVQRAVRRQHADVPAPLLVGFDLGHVLGRGLGREFACSGVYHETHAGSSAAAAMGNEEGRNQIGGALMSRRYGTGNNNHNK